MAKTRFDYNRINQQFDLENLAQTSHQGTAKPAYHNNFHKKNNKPTLPEPVQLTNQSKFMTQEPTINDNFTDLYEVVKTVRFGLRTFNTERKNKSYQDISDKFKNNEEIKRQIDKLSNRINQSTNKDSWEESKKDFQGKISSLKKFITSIKTTLDNLENLKDDSKNNFKIIFKVNLIKKSCGFGKDLFHFKEETRDPKNVNLSQFVNYNKLENVRKHSEKYNNCINKFEVYKLFITEKLDYSEEKANQIEILLTGQNHEKARLEEIYSGFQKILNTLELVDNIFHKSISFSGGQLDAGSKLQSTISQNTTNYTNLKSQIEEAIENIHDPKHGYEIGKATLHYRTINKRFVPNDKIEDIQKLLGTDSIKDAEFYNPLAKFSSEILEKIKNKKVDNRLEIEKGGTVVEKAKKVIDLVKVIPGVREEWVNLWNICNSLNNKKQTYDRFITQNECFESLGWKQKLKFGLTILVDCDVYQPGDFINRCKELESETRNHLKKIGFTKYEEYKNFTVGIESGDHVSNKRPRGRLISGYLDRDFVLVNKEISQIRGALDNYLKFLHDNENGFKGIQYFTVLARNKDEKGIVLLIDRGESKEFYNKVNSSSLKTGAEKLYLYDSITEKAVKKLFNQSKSENHPFIEYKQELANKKDKEFDGLKFSDLILEEVKELLKRDVAKIENWSNKFEKFYSKLDKGEFKNEKDLLKTLTKDAFVLEEKHFDLESLQKEFPNLIVCDLEMNKNQKKDSIHQDYFERAFKKMITHKNVDAKINPEFQIYYAPQKDEYIKKEKEGNLNLKRLEENHRFWRDSVTLGIPIEVYPKKPNEKINKFTRVIGIDRGEKKIATLCHLEKSEGGEFILPIEYYDQNDLKNIKKTYFLDLANYKVGRNKGTQVLIKISKSQDGDTNLELKKYEFITRFIKTIWEKNNREQIQKVLIEFNNEKIDVRGFVNKITYTEDQKKKGLNKNQIFSNDGLGIYQKGILKDEMVLEKFVEVINNFNNFKFKNEKEDVEKEEVEILRQKDLELQKIRLRDSISSNISGIVNFFFKQNKDKGITTFCALENLHNSAYRNFVSKNVITGRNEINEDFVEATHHKLYQTSIYAKVEQAIMNKLQLFNNQTNNYLDYVYSIKEENDKKKHIPIKQIQFELKDFSKYAKKEQEKFKDKTLEIQPTKYYGHLAFVDPSYTSKRCPKCNQEYPSNSNFRNYSNDYLDCNKQVKGSCDYQSKNTFVDSNSNLNKIKLDDACSVIHLGDENGAFFIGLRCLKLLPTTSPSGG